MDKLRILRELIKRSRNDFDSYFLGTPLADRARQITEMAVCGDASLRRHGEKLKEMIPDTEQDGSWQCSYALNVGVMIESLIAFQATGRDEHYENAVTSFFDSVDFKVQEELEKTGVDRATEDQIASHPLMMAERAWFDGLTKQE
jgi:hypothetical protein